MITVERSLRTALDPAAALAYVSAFEHTSEWDPFTEVSTRVGAGADEPVGVGSAFALQCTFDGRPQNLRYAITALDDRSVTLRGEHRAVLVTETVTVTALRVGTSLRYRARYRLRGWRRLAQPFVRRRFLALAEPGIEGLRQRLDALARPPA